MIAKADQSSLEATFDYYWRLLAPPTIKVERQLKFNRYKIDFAIPDAKIAVELDGGRGGGYGRQVNCQACGAVVRARTKGGGIGKPIRLPYPSHSGEKQERDARKQNELTADGWAVLRYSSEMIAADPEGAINQIVWLWQERKP